MFDYRYLNPHQKTSSPAQPACPSTLEVFGEGSVSAAPDRAVIELGVVTEGLVLQTVQSENAKAVTNVIQSLTALNIPKEKIQTSAYHIEAVYDYEDGKQIFRGYKVTHLLKITSDRVGQAGQIVDTAVASGANTVNSIVFTIAHPEIYENQALILAIENARQKAQTIAHTLGSHLSSLPCFVQQIPHGTEPIPHTTALYATSTPTPIEPGQLTIYAAVQVKYPFA